MKIENMLYIEDKYNLLGKKIGSFSYWTYCRYHIWQKYIIPLKTGIVDLRENKKSLKIYFEECVSLLKSSITNSSIPNGQYDICFMNHERRQRLDGFYKCIYTEFLSEHFTNSFTVERTYQHKHLQPVKTNNLIYIDYIEVKSNLYSLFHRKIKSRRYFTVLSFLRKDLEEPLKELGTLYDIAIDLDFVCEIIIKFYFIYLIKVKYFSNLLRKYKPKLIVEVVGYNMDCMIVNELTYDTNIKTIEFEHGIIGREHLAYGFYSDSKPKTIKQFPQNLYVFSNYFIKETKLPLTNIHEMGYPFLEFMKKKYPPKARNGSSLTILFISQTQNGEKLSQIAAECLPLLEDYHVHIIYKLHPKEIQTWRQSYPQLLSNAIEVIDTLDINIYECFSRADIQVGGNSTAIYEGLSYNLPTYIVNYAEVGEAIDLCDEGLATLFEDTDELVSLIKEANYHKTPSDNLWKKHAITAYIQELERALDEA